jgi:hypothetical protein
MSGRAWLRGGVCRARHSLAVAASASAAVATFACGTLPAEGETGPPSESGRAACPSSNPPNALTLIAGTPQSATLGSAFASDLQVALANSDGCPLTTPVAGTPVTFSAPSDGASGLFSASGSNTVMVGSGASGTAVAPTFTANDTAGSYTVTASSLYGSVSFSLRNAEGSESSACGAFASAAPVTAPMRTDLAGKPTKLTAGIGSTQAAPVGKRFPIRFAVTVTDAEKNPVPAVQVTFAAPARGPSGRFTVRSEGSHGLRSRTPHVHEVEVKTDACGIALAPAFTANQRPGGYIVVASAEYLKAAFALVNEGP